jgi:hypothetical protein
MRAAVFNGPDTPITIERVADPHAGAIIEAGKAVTG